MEAIRSGPRGKSVTPRGPFAVWLHAPEFGHRRRRWAAIAVTRPRSRPRLSEFAILCTARLWKAQYEWFAHAPMAEKAGVKDKDDRRPACRARAEIRAQGRARDFCLHPANSTDQPRQRPHLQTRARRPRRRGNGRVGRYPRLLRDDLDDAQRIPHDAAGGRRVGIRRAVVTAVTSSACRPCRALRDRRCRPWHRYLRPRSPPRPCRPWRNRASL